MQVSELEEEPIWPVLPSKKRSTHAEPSQWVTPEVNGGHGVFSFTVPRERYWIRVTKR